MIMLVIKTYGELGNLKKGEFYGRKKARKNMDRTILDCSY